jgi:hypothetical protein
MAVEERPGWQRTCEQGGDQYASRTAAEDSARNTQGGDRDSSEQGNDRYVSTEHCAELQPKNVYGFGREVASGASPAKMKKYQNFIIFNFHLSYSMFIAKSD